MDLPVEVADLRDEQYFQILNGLWTGKKAPFVEAHVIRNTNFRDDGTIDYTDVAVLDVEQRQLSTKQLKPGDIIIERSGGGPKQPVGRVVYFDREDGVFSFSNFTSVVRVRSAHVFDPRYVFYCLIALYRSGGTEDIQRRTTGIRNLDFAAYKERASLLRLPLEEQKTIAATLQLAHNSVKLQERILDHIAELKQAVRRELFEHGTEVGTQDTELGPVPSNWEVAPLGSIAKLRSGGTPSRRRLDYWEGGDIPWVKTGEVDYKRIDDTAERITAAGLANSSATLFPAGTVLMAMYGQGKTRGKVGILGTDAATNQACVAIFPDDRVRSKFLYHFFEHHYERIRNLGHGANQKNLSAEILKSLTVAHPADLDEQDRIVQALDTLDAKADLITTRRELQAELFASLLDRLIGAARADDQSASRNGSVREVAAIIA